MDLDLSRISSSIERVGKGAVDALSISTVDLLTSREIDELRDLVERMDSGELKMPCHVDPDRQGMYAALSDIGLISCMGHEAGLVLYGVSRKAVWVVERFDMAEKARRKRERREAIHFWLGLAIQLVAVVLAWWLGLHSGAFQTPTP